MIEEDRACINCHISLPLDAYSSPTSMCCKLCGIELRRELDGRYAAR